MKKSKLVWGLACLIFVVILGYFYFNGRKIPAIKVEKKDYVEKILVTGTVQGLEYSTLTSGLDGVVEEIYIREGNPMKKGDAIAKLNTQMIDADIAQAQALYDAAKYELERINILDLQNAQANLNSAKIAYNTSKNEFFKYEKLFKQKYVTQLDYDAKKNAFSAAEAQLKNAQAQLESVQQGGAINKTAVSNMEAARQSLESLIKTRLKYFVYAPYDGYVTSRNIEIGQAVAPYTSMFLVSSSNDKIISINMDEKYTNRVSLNAPVKIYPYADTSKYSEGQIYYLAVSVDDATGTREVRTTLDKKFPEFLYMSTVNAVIEGVKVKDGILLQGLYTIPVKNKMYAYVYKRGKAIFTEVEGIPVIDGFIVTKGLEDKDIVLLPRDISDGDRVKLRLEIDAQSSKNDVKNLL